MQKLLTDLWTGFIWFTDNLARGFGWAVSIVAIAAGLNLMSLAFPVPFDATDDAAAKVRSGMNVLTDNETGCQYLTTLGGMTPRSGRDGMQICGR